MEHEIDQGRAGDPPGEVHQRDHGQPVEQNLAPGDALEPFAGDVVVTEEEEHRVVGQHPQTDDQQGCHLQVEAQDGAGEDRPDQNAEPGHPSQTDEQPGVLAEFFQGGLQSPA